MLSCSGHKIWWVLCEYTHALVKCDGIQSTLADNVVVIIIIIILSSSMAHFRFANQMLWSHCCRKQITYFPIIINFISLARQCREMCVCVFLASNKFEAFVVSSLNSYFLCDFSLSLPSACGTVTLITFIVIWAPVYVNLIWFKSDISYAAAVPEPHQT